MPLYSREKKARKKKNDGRSLEFTSTPEAVSAWGSSCDVAGKLGLDLNNVARKSYLISGENKLTGMLMTVFFAKQTTAKFNFELEVILLNGVKRASCNSRQI